MTAAGFSNKTSTHTDSLPHGPHLNIKSLFLSQHITLPPTLGLLSLYTASDLYTSYCRQLCIPWWMCQNIVQSLSVCRLYWAIFHLHISYFNCNLFHFIFGSPCFCRTCLYINHSLAILWTTCSTQISGENRKFPFKQMSSSSHMQQNEAQLLSQDAGDK